MIKKFLIGPLILFIATLFILAYLEIHSLLIAIGQLNVIIFDLVRSKCI